MQLRQPRLAEMVASILRERIINGELSDGDALPRQEDLLEEFSVSKPSLREALRILEAEGLITVRRGNRGGAIVHVPKAENAAYMIGLVLQFRDVPFEDVGAAMQLIEPVCAGLLAERPDDEREEAVAELREINEDVKEAIDDEVEFTMQSRRFHEKIVASCGNQTLILMVGALESLWTNQEETWAEQATARGEFPAPKQRQAGIRAHERLLELFEEGDRSKAERAARKHLEASLYYTMTAAADKTVESRGLLNGVIRT